MRKQEERQWTLDVVRGAKLRGWRVYHVPDSRRATCAGFPDLVLLHDDYGMVVAELKTDKGRTTEPQEEWLQGFRNAGVSAGVWRPRDREAVWRILEGRT